METNRIKKIGFIDKFWQKHKIITVIKMQLYAAAALKVHWWF